MTGLRAPDIQYLTPTFSRILNSPGVALQFVDQELMEIYPSWICIVLTGIW